MAPRSCFVCIPDDREVVNRDVIEPAGSEVVHRLAFLEDIHLVHVVLDHSEIKVDDIILVVLVLKVDLSEHFGAGKLNFDIFDVVAHFRAGLVIGIRDSDLNPVERAVGGVIEDLPLDVVEHVEGRVLVYIHCNGVVKYLVCGRRGLNAYAGKRDCRNNDERG